MLFAEIQSCFQMLVFAAAGFSLRRTGETPMPPKKLRERYFLGDNPLLQG
jgi:hypothetical protein